MPTTLPLAKMRWPALSEPNPHPQKNATARFTPQQEANSPCHPIVNTTWSCVHSKVLPWGILKKYSFSVPLWALVVWFSNAPHAAPSTKMH
jgi:hypothetical protein